MGSGETDNPVQIGSAWKRWLGRAAIAIAILAAGALAFVWGTREQIAGNLIDDYLAEAGLQATYEIAQIGAKTQVIENVVVGDPAAPDLTIERVSVGISYGLGSAGIGSVVLEKPRLHGSYRDGELSLGALDPILFDTGSDAGGLPQIDLTVKDAGALFETGFGDFGATLNGEGPLDDGFLGKLAIVAPGIGVESCSAAQASAYGDLTTSNGTPQFTGPVRLRDAECGGAQISQIDIGADLSTNEELDSIRGELALSAGALKLGQIAASTLDGNARFSLNAQSLVLDHDVGLGALITEYASVARLNANGTLRSGGGFSQSSWEAQLVGEQFTLSKSALATLDGAGNSAEGTLFAPLLTKLERSLSGAMQSAQLSGSVAARMDADSQSFTVPEARLRSARGETLLALSRFNWSQIAERKGARLAANFLTGGSGIPQVTGRMEREAGGALVLRMAMAPYREGENSLAMPRLSLRQTSSGAFLLAGVAEISGVIPGGAVNALTLPLEGRFDPRSGLVLGRNCATASFEGLTYYNLALQRQDLRLCPAENAAMLSYSDSLDIAIVSEGLALEGTISDAPSRVAAEQASFRYPGGFDLAGVEASFGSQDNAVQLTSAELWGEFGEDISGSFSGASAMINAVPLDLTELAGNWVYRDGVLEVSDALLTVTERTDGYARFEPLAAQGASLMLDGGTVFANALLRHRQVGTEITRVAITHDLTSGEGSAVLNVDELTFGPSFGVEDLTGLAKGVIAYTNGSISGEGRINWTTDNLTSTGEFRSDGFDLAAAFGPVKGLRGEIRFSDLLNLTTYPSQEITIGSINPGIEAFAGKVRFAMTNGQNIEIEDARWPFMKGTLVMEPTILRYGTDDEQSYTFNVKGLDAATFVAEMELTNIGATGTFDGTVPIVFDAFGDGRIVGGTLDSRPPGGNVSYIGELTYEDLGTISNYAFEALRSLDYTQMSVGLDGDLAGEIITRFEIEGVRQGEEASKNFITRRLAKLPIRFDINVRSENFYELASMVRTFWDPDALPDPIDQGVMRSDGTMRGQQAGGSPPVMPDPAPDTNENPNAATRPDEPGVQPPESEYLP
ncbi:MAG: YdbH domain-containing protein [Pseudomonadota bacterium]